MITSDVATEALLLLQLTYPGSYVQRCRTCHTCTFDCKKCIACEDKVIYGGEGKRKQGCKNRKECVFPRLICKKKRSSESYCSLNDIFDYKRQEQTHAKMVETALYLLADCIYNELHKI